MPALDCAIILVFFTVQLTDKIFTCLACGLLAFLFGFVPGGLAEFNENTVKN
jgi:hypothetical protein